MKFKIFKKKKKVKSKTLRFTTLAMREEMNPPKKRGRDAGRRERFSEAMRRWLSKAMTVRERLSEAVRRWLSG